MKYMIIGLLLAMACAAHADSEFGEFQHITNKSFHSRFFLKGQLFIMNQTGKRLLSPTGDIREWRSGIDSNKIDALWKTKAKGIADIAVHLIWKINDDNSLSVILKQYDSIGGRGLNEAKYGKLIREKKFDLENFDAVTWVAQKAKTFRVVLRFVPDLETYHEYQNLDKIAIGPERGSFIVADNQGHLWGENVRFGGVISGMSSYRGAFVISFYPFKKSKVMGYASGKSIVLNPTHDLRVKMWSDDAVVPGDGRIKVYGYYNPDFKMKRVTSEYSFGVDKISQVPKGFGL